ncbi:MAG: hypothetical protein LUP94_02945 [Candidatus Methanomethylicus sp.]|jgi:hypothetical protein|nr:hypothetical protein [Candidatus Methanomethylicus sp.]
MGSIDSIYDKVKKYIHDFASGRGASSAMTGYMSGELQTVVFIMIIAAFFRLFSIPLGMVILIGVVAAVLYFAPTIKTMERENASDLNQVLFWVVIYFAAIIAVTLWGR